MHGDYLSNGTKQGEHGDGTSVRERLQGERAGCGERQRYRRGRDGREREIERETKGGRAKQAKILTFVDGLEDRC